MARIHGVDGPRPGGWGAWPTLRREQVFSNPEMSMNGPLGGAEGGCEGEG